jgi:exonuclease SbcC
MRPLRLSLRGLRSYRDECTVDFTEAGLVAIVGDTGAGKSSLLEAITYALYNATTWDAAATRQLIADGVHTMSVQLDFQAGEHVWRVHRAASRGSYPPSVHRLTCLSDPAEGTFDGEEAVNRQIAKLLGMSYRAFLAAVILPQGRFQTLLQERPAERTRILEGIFRLTELRTVRGLADDLRQRAQAGVQALEARRAALLPDPAAEVAARRAALAEAAERETLLGELEAAARAADEAGRRAEEQARSLREPAKRVRAANRGVPVALRGLAVAARELEAQLATAQESERRLREEEGALAAAIAEAARLGETVEDLARAEQTLVAVRRRLVELAADSERLAAEQRAIDEESAAMRDAAVRLPELEEAAAAAQERARAAGVAAEAERERRGEASARLARARQAQESLDSSAAEAARRSEALPGLERASSAAAEREDASTARLASARERLAAEQRRHAAAHAAEGLGPGDPCPVCARTLPPDFEPPTGLLDEPERAVVEAEQEARTAHETKIEAGAALAAGRIAAEEAAQRRVTAEADLSAVVERLRDVLPAADLDSTDDEVMASPAAAVTELTAAAEAANIAASAAGEALVAARAHAGHREQGWWRRREAAERDRERIDRGRGQSSEDLGTLARFGRGKPRPSGDGPDIDELAGEVTRRLAEARARRDERERVRHERDEAARAIDALRERREREVEAPRARALGDLAALRLRVDDALRALGWPPALAAPDDAEQAAALERQAEDVAADLERRAAGLEADRARQAAALTERLRAAGFADGEALRQEARDVQRRIGEAKGRLREAEAQVPLAAELQTRIAAGAEIQRSLEELVRLLADGQFIRHVIERRQRTLLAVASGTLGSMTQDRYGFSEDFEMVDRLSGQPRPPRTLSGGETFLASLALALALVEIAGRAGTRLDALFLDEGFGSLDANALDEALSALERRAGQGRLVAVVSHIRAVAERLERVLEVTRTPAGSRAEWRDPSERNAMVERELEAGLLA